MSYILAQSDILVLSDIAPDPSLKSSIYPKLLCFFQVDSGILKRKCEPYLYLPGLLLLDFYRL